MTARGAGILPVKAIAAAGMKTPARRPVFDWGDSFGLDAALAEEERLVRDTARAFGEEKLMPRVVEAFREERIDRSVIRELGELGFLGSTLHGSTDVRARATLPMALRCARSNRWTRAAAP